jgi:hypothetical protein
LTEESISYGVSVAYLIGSLFYVQQIKTNIKRLMTEKRQQIGTGGVLYLTIFFVQQEHIIKIAIHIINLFFSFPLFAAARRWRRCRRRIAALRYHQLPLQVQQDGDGGVNVRLGCLAGLQLTHRLALGRHGLL